MVYKGVKSGELVILIGKSVSRGFKCTFWVMSLNLSADKTGSIIFFHLSSKVVQKVFFFTDGEKFIMW